jgi:hypothetical protein
MQVELHEAPKFNSFTTEPAVWLARKSRHIDGRTRFRRASLTVATPPVDQRTAEHDAASADT